MSIFGFIRSSPSVIAVIPSCSNNSRTPGRSLALPKYLASSKGFSSDSATAYPPIFPNYLSRLTCILYYQAPPCLLGPSTLARFSTSHVVKKNLYCHNLRAWYPLYLQDNPALPAPLSDAPTPTFLS